MKEEKSVIEASPMEAMRVKEGGKGVVGEPSNGLQGLEEEGRKKERREEAEERSGLHKQETEKERSLREKLRN